MSRKGPLLIAVAALAVIAAIVMAMFSAHHNATAPPSQGDTKVNPKDGLSYVWIPNRVSRRLKIDPGNRFQFPAGFRCVGE